jgi:hypothetical protein
MLKDRYKGSTASMLVPQTRIAFYFELIAMICTQLRNYTELILFKYLHSNFTLKLDSHQTFARLIVSYRT